MVLPWCWGNLCRGIRETDPKLLELAAAYRFFLVEAGAAY